MPSSLAAVFDLDDCLIDTSHALTAYAHWFADAYGVPVEAVTEADRRHAGQRHAFFTDLKENFGIKDPITQLYGQYRQRAPRLSPFRPEVCQMVRELSDAGWRLAVLSNGSPDVQWTKLRHSGLHSYFPSHRVVISGEWGPRKPDPALFNIALDALEVSTAVMVGDSLREDIAGGAAAGLRTVWIANGRQLHDGDPQPDHVVQTVTEVSRLLRTTEWLVPLPD
ncbi:HAD family hydrolase [Streptomyces sp. XH2]|uniref:HAD family hydrolase n=1 Tax=Streptomyces sp. XH2 TaxID=3412483 RepID=UPI003C7D6CA4